MIRTFDGMQSHVVRVMNLQSSEYREEQHNDHYHQKYTVTSHVKYSATLNFPLFLFNNASVGKIKINGLEAWISSWRPGESDVAVTEFHLKAEKTPLMMYVIVKICSI